MCIYCYISSVITPTTIHRVSSYLLLYIERPHTYYYTSSVLMLTAMHL